MEALVIGGMAPLSAALPSLLFRAGFAVDIVTMSNLMRLSRCARIVYTKATLNDVVAFAEKLAASRAKPYDWVIITDDCVLGETVAQERRTGQKSCILPLQSGRSRNHLYSKIGLSQALADAGIRTPDFRAVSRVTQAIVAAHEIGYPVFVKRDASCGGAGVFECADETALRALPDVWTEPVLIQKKIDGTELDLSALFLNGALVHFSYSQFERSIRRFGPSSLRRYFPLQLVDPSVFDELSDLGKALGAHGFSNITAIDASDGGGRYYIEADMRPNVWVDFSQHLGDDTAIRIRNWYGNGMALSKDNAAPPGAPSTIQTIPHFLRYTLFELVFNRDHVRSYIPRVEAPLMWALILRGVFRRIIAVIRRSVPRAWKRALRRRLAAKSRSLQPQA